MKRKAEAESQQLAKKPNQKAIQSPTEKLFSWLGSGQWTELSEVEKEDAPYIFISYINEYLIKNQININSKNAQGQSLLYLLKTKLEPVFIDIYTEILSNEELEDYVILDLDFMKLFMEKLKANNFEDKDGEGEFIEDLIFNYFNLELIIEIDREFINNFSLYIEHAAAHEHYELEENYPSPADFIQYSKIIHFCWKNLMVSEKEISQNLAKSGFLFSQPRFPQFAKKALEDDFQNRCQKYFEIRDILIHDLTKKATDPEIKVNFWTREFLKSEEAYSLMVEEKSGILKL